MNMSSQFKSRTVDGKLKCHAEKTALTLCNRMLSCITPQYNINASTVKNVMWGNGLHHRTYVPDYSNDDDRI